MQEDTFSGRSAYPDQVGAVKANDEKTLQQLYHNNFRNVENFVLKNSGTSEQAKDVFQEAFIAMWRNVLSGKFEQKTAGSLDAYLMQIAKNKWLDYLRSAAYKKTKKLEDQALQHLSLSEEETEQEDQKYIEEVREKFQQLGENCREVLTRFYYKKQSLREIAAFFNWTETTAKNNKYRCLERLRTLVKTKK